LSISDWNAFERETTTHAWVWAGLLRPKWPELLIHEGLCSDHDATFAAAFVF